MRSRRRKRSSFCNGCLPTTSPFLGTANSRSMATATPRRSARFPAVNSGCCACGRSLPAHDSSWPCGRPRAPFCSMPARPVLAERDALSGTPTGVPDHISIKVLDDRGKVIGERALVGLFTSGVYTDSPRSIPLLRKRFDAIVERAGFLRGGFDDKVLRQVLATFPREELFQSTPDELFETALRITRNHERNQMQVFVREDRYDCFSRPWCSSRARSTTRPCGRAFSRCCARSSSQRRRVQLLLLRIHPHSDALPASRRSRCCACLVARAHHGAHRRVGTQLGRRSA